MSPIVQTPPSSGSRSPRRNRLLAGVAVLALLGVGTFSLSPLLVRDVAQAQSTQSQTAQLQATPNRLTASSFSFADVVERVRPAVVSVRVKTETVAEPMQFGGEDDEAAPMPPGGMERFFREFGERFGRGGPHGFGPRQPHRFGQSQGSGFFISADGYIVTNNHVVDRAASVEVVTDDGRTLNAKVVGTDQRTDLALLKVDGGSYPFVTLGEKAPRIGDWVVAVGNPFGLGGTVTAGIISARGRDIGSGPYDDFVQIDAPVNRGNSGGPTFNLDGEVIGVNTAIFSPSGGSVGIAFAIPAETVRTVVTSLREHGTVTRGWIGVQIQPVTAEIADGLGLSKAEGALVADPQPNGPAAKAGIKAGDVITQVNGKPVRDARELARRIAAEKPGEAIKLTVVSDRKERTVELKPGQFPDDQQAPKRFGQVPSDRSVPHLGLTLAPTPDGSGVAVRDIEPGGPAAAAGLRQGDQILDVNGRSVGSIGDVREAVQAATDAKKRSVLMRVKNGESSRFVALKVGQG
ncbi:Do family serine endopeptidase [Blastochloris viridis]|uniref:Probable periplasmic serine endoprotease DegP-like n=1 Tax=Blastochloris viridis TaxID=1079 RepID=A0A0H5BPW5_BLAVI|nr:Do family serine endopeptidase [Blastochloris viridis]ALK10100.1 putative periplasmic serine endoprotease DegP-like precursor [Blastochloris viridis]BAR99973.1 serine protease precursor MucD/AlgY associated with sigma factor RpoE [Blastochloris viridis]CUU42764.1 putative periplasmic serine endoprotease DegP-like precursor [Blastochloris viridis]